MDSCPDCSGGWVPVGEDYVQQQATQQLRLGAAEYSDPFPGRLMALRNSVYPCPTCRHEKYTLWLDGHLAPNHVCAVCMPPRRRRKAA